MSSKLQSIVDLHTTVVELAEARELLEGVPDWMKELHEEHSGRQAEIDVVADKSEEATKERRAAEAALADAQEKAKHYQSQISQVSTQREYTALLKEIDTVKAQIGDLEKQVLESIDVHDQAEKDLDELREGFRDLDERYKAELAKWEAEKPAVAARVKDLTRQAEGFRSQLPRRVLGLYDRIFGRHDVQTLSRVIRIKARGGQAMWHCEACSYNVRPQVAIEIRTAGSIAQCDSCKRILYLDEDDEE